MDRTLIIGSAHTEYIAHVKQLPKGNEEFQPDDIMQTTGGSGFKSAYVFHGFDFPYNLIAPIGTGVYGDAVKEDMEDCGIVTEADSDEVAGCTYRMIDQQGSESVLCVPGAEYSYDLSYTENLYPQEISNIALFGEMLSGDGVDDILETLDDMSRTVYFMPGDRIENAPEKAVDDILKLHPVLHLTDTEAYYFSKEKAKELKETADTLFHMTDAPVMILREGEGTYYMDRDDTFLAPEKDRMDPDLHVAAYLCARNAGVDLKNAVMFANHFAAMSKAGELPDEKDFEEQKKRLAGMILQK